MDEERCQKAASSECDLTDQQETTLANKAEKERPEIQKWILGNSYVEEFQDVLDQRCWFLLRRQ